MEKVYGTRAGAHTKKWKFFSEIAFLVILNLKFWANYFLNSKNILRQRAWKIFKIIVQFNGALLYIYN